MEATGALEELLLEQRTLVNHALYPLLEDMSHQEPTFWQLQVVEFIRSVLKSRVGSCIDAAVRTATTEVLQDPAHVLNCVKTRVQTSSELQEALIQLQSDVEKEVVRLKEIMNVDVENHLKAPDSDEPFVVKFWEKLQDAVEMRYKQQKHDEERGVEGVEQEFESCSFERLSFDEDFNDMSRSAMRCAKQRNNYLDFPTTIRRMQSADVVERAAGLDEFMRMPVVEVVHSGPVFPAACSALVGLFLDTDILLEFMGSHLETGELFLYRQDISESTDVRSIAVLDCFRVLHTLLFKIMRHWVYISAEALAQVLHSTFRLLVMYSKGETEAEAKRANPLTMLFLIDDDPVRWFKLWLLNVPSSRQLFVAMDESGFIADILQYLSRARPLAPIKSSNSSVDVIEKRTVQCVLTVLSYICEYQQGRDLVSQWQRLPAHAYIKQRHTSCERAAVESIAAENDSLYHTVQHPVSAEEPRDELEADYKHLGKGVVDAVILSLATIIVTVPCSQKDVMFNERWTTSISNSVATYLHCADVIDLLPAFTKIIDACWADNSCKMSATSELEEKNPWFPFRQPKSATEVCQLVTDSISKRARRGVLSSELQSSGQCILRMVMSSKAVTYAVTQTPNSDTTELIFELCKRYLQSQHYEAMEQGSCDSSGLFDLIMDTAVIPQAFKVADKIGVINELWKACSSFSEQSDSRDFLALAACGTQRQELATCTIQ
ncbi:hypothetical protein GQ600_3290 [Phytophthora cactorum]|nr:hypothetical protein GQ600_3290 [Phytophthora cactorum]